MKCQNCKTEFKIDKQDKEFYQKIEVPYPTFCPDCRAQRRFAFWNDLKVYLRKDDYHAYRKEIKRLFALLSSIDKKLKLYIQEVIGQAKLKKGFKLFEYGMSIAKASKIMGITRWELMNYVGNTKVFDREKISTNMSKRLAFTRSLFK